MSGSGQIEKKAMLIVLPTEDGGVDVVKNRYGLRGRMTMREFAAIMAEMLANVADHATLSGRSCARSATRSADPNPLRKERHE